MIRKYLYVLAVFGVALCGVLQQPVCAEAPSVALGVKVGTLGVGIDAVTRITDTINGRFGLQGFTYDVSGTTSDIEYDADLELSSGLLVADWFPFRNSFRVSLGFLFNGNELGMTGKAAADATFDIGGVIYTAPQVGTLDANVAFNTIAPYVGIGLGNPFSRESNWSFFFDLGVAFQGSAEVELTASGPFASDPTFQANLERERQELEDELDEYLYYPAASLGVSYRF
jgi:hypothetical protein